LSCLCDRGYRSLPTLCRPESRIALLSVRQHAPGWSVAFDTRLLEPPVLSQRNPQLEKKYDHGLEARITMSSSPVNHGFQKNQSA
jgi:hypothetical protein